MAEWIEKSPQSVGTSDALTKAVVTYIVPELRVGSFLSNFWHGQPKNAVADIKFRRRAIDFELKVTTKKNQINYTHSVKKLPGEISPADCIQKFYNGKVVLVLAKVKEESWEAALSSSGLDLD